MDISLYILIIHGFLLHTVMCEICPVYTDGSNVTHSAFYCPEAVRLVGKSDFYCCLNGTDGLHYCCSDRRKSLYHSDMTYGQEAFMLYWPFLAMGGLIAGFVICIPYTKPRESEVKHESTAD